MILQMFLDLAFWSNWSQIIGTILAFIVAGVPAVLYFIRVRKLSKFNPSLEVHSNFEKAWENIVLLISGEFKAGRKVELKNIGLDLEKILPNISEFLEHYQFGKIHGDFTYKGLLINPDSVYLKPMIDGDSNIRSKFVHSSFERIDVLTNQFKNKGRFSFAIKQYDFPPVIHGILINNNHLFLGLTEIKDRKLYGSDQPYIYLKFDDRIATTQHYFKSYNDWFDYFWNNEKK